MAADNESVETQKQKDLPKPFYINRHGDLVEVEISSHARSRFCQRWANVYPENPLLEYIDKTLIEWFAKAKRIETKSGKYKIRLRRYGKDTLYFASPPFVFVVQSASIITVELGTKNTRHMNNKVSKLKEKKLASIEPEVIKQLADVSPQPLFKLAAYALDENGILRFVNLGKYDSSIIKGNAELLRNDMAFRDEVLNRFRNKRSSWTLLSVFARIGKNVKEVLEVFDQEVNITANG